MKWEAKLVATISLAAFILTGCAYNPFSCDSQLTGSATGTAVGATVGAGSTALLGGSKTMIVAGGIVGAAIGYYVTTLRFDSGGIMQACGQVYKVGDQLGIYIPTDSLFEPNTDEFIPQATPVLDSAVAVLRHYPNNNILISGNTSGFYRARWEQRLSELRAQKVAAYLWNAGINQFKDMSSSVRKLSYVGYGDFFPIATTRNNEGLRQNSRIQITSYPGRAQLGLCKRVHTFNNYAPLCDQDEELDEQPCCNNCKPCSTCGTID